MEKMIGRSAEQEMLERILKSDEAELVAVYGRRRVGKTFLIRNYYKDNLAFEFTGIHEATLKTQLENFVHTLQKVIQTKMPIATPKNWVEAFSLLDHYINTLPVTKPIVLFFDEFPWIHTQKSGFLQAFDHWWNSSASKLLYLKVIICGSAASWMIENVINSKAGLHNRVTQSIRLLPFTLSETAQYLRNRGVKLDSYQVLQIYMSIGGIPHYLKNILPGESSAQVIDKLCFTKDGLLKGEFKNLYRSLFINPDHHEAVVRALAKKGKGLTRNEIIKECRFSSGGTTTRILKELEESGFIISYSPFGKNEKESIYKLSDEYSLFYLKFIEHAKATGSGTWLRQLKSPSYNSWSGFAFESVCQKHYLFIKKALGIESVHTQSSSWRHFPEKSETQGAQIDLLLDRADRCINICEIKFSSTEFTIDKKYAKELDNKINVFEAVTKTKKTLFLTMITTYGIKKNEYSTSRVQAEVTIKDLIDG
ncbi:MAG: ATP-binding protein [Bacteroidota bacterium]